MQRRKGKYRKARIENFGLLRVRSPSAGAKRQKKDYRSVKPLKPS
ncbi:hypothetical protein [Helicobacter sp. 12S02634-8]|nr:hypothetical protein [Helicobacter sp. 12S02634-8]